MGIQKYGFTNCIFINRYKIKNLKRVFVVTTKILWVSGFVLSLVTFIIIVIYRLGNVQKIKNNSDNIIYSLRNQIIPNFWIYTNRGNMVKFYDFLDAQINIILFLGNGCFPCDDLTIKVLSQYEKSKNRPSNIAIQILVQRGDQEFQHLRKLTYYNFSGPIGKFNANLDNIIPTYPALLVISKEKWKVLDLYFPRYNEEENKIKEFLTKFSTYD